MLLDFKNEDSSKKEATGTDNEVVNEKIQLLGDISGRYGDFTNERAATTDDKKEKTDKRNCESAK